MRASRRSPLRAISSSAAAALFLAVAARADGPAPVLTLPAPPDVESISEIAFSPDGKLLAAAFYHSGNYQSPRLPVKLWSIPDGKEAFTFEGCNIQPLSLGFSKDGKFLVYLGDQSRKKERTYPPSWNKTNLYPELKVYRLADGKKTLDLDDPVPSTLDLGDEQIDVTFENNKVKAYRLADGKKTTADDERAKWRETLGWIGAHQPGSSASPDHKLMVGFTYDPGEITITDLSTRTQIKSLHPHRKQVRGLALSPDGRILASSSEDGTLKFLRFPEGTEISSLDTGATPLRFSPDGEFLLTQENRLLNILTVPQGKSVLSLQFKESIQAMDFSPQGRLFAVALNREIQIYQFESLVGEERKAVEAERAPLDAAIAANPDNADVFRKRAAFFFQRKDYDKAVSDLDTAVSKDGQNPRARVLRATVKERLGQFGNAIDDLSVALGSAKHRELIYLQRGVDRFALGEAEAALSDLTEAIHLEPKLSKAFLYRGLILLAAGEPGQAVVEFTAAVKADPKSDAAVFNRGLAYRARGDRARAIEDYSKALELNPKNSIAYSYRGIAHMEAGEDADAFSDLTQALALDSSDADSYNYRGFLYLKRIAPELIRAQLVAKMWGRREHER